jgi:hypothetical protein
MKDILTNKEETFMANQSKKDGGTKQKNSKHKAKNKTSGSANGPNSYH